MGPKRTLQTSSSVGQMATSTSAGSLSRVTSSMATLEARLATFSSKASPKWPHPHHPRSKKAHVPTPPALAAAGFFYAPDPDGTRKKDDRLQHYLCATTVSSWQPGDDPLDRLRAANPSCPTVVLADSAEAQLEAEAWRAEAEEAPELPSAHWDDPVLFPLSEQMLAARIASFQAIPWPHDPPHARGWKPTSTRLAEAGFHATVTEEGDDTATCAYCGRVLSGWEKLDDPRAEHLRGERPCPFFSAVFVGRQAREQKEQDKSTLLAASDTDDPVQLPKSHRRQAVPDEESGADKVAQLPRKVSSKTTRSASSASRTSKRDDAEEVEAYTDEDDEDDAPPSRPARAAKSKATSKTKSAESRKTKAQAGGHKKAQKQVVQSDSDEEMEELSEHEADAEPKSEAQDAAEPEQEPELDSQELVSQELALSKRRALSTRSTSRTTRSASRAVSRTASAASRKASTASRQPSAASIVPKPDAAPAAEPEEEEKQDEAMEMEAEESMSVRRRFVPSKPPSQSASARSTRSTTTGATGQAKSLPKEDKPPSAPSQSKPDPPLAEDKLGRAANSAVPPVDPTERSSKLKAVLAAYPEDVRARTERAIEQGMTVHDFLSAEAERALGRQAEEGKLRLASLEQQAAKYRVLYERTLRGLK